MMKIQDVSTGFIHEDTDDLFDDALDDDNVEDLKLSSEFIAGLERAYARLDRGERGKPLAQVDAEMHVLSIKASVR